MIVDIAILVFGAALPSTCARGFQGHLITHGPGHQVQAVHRLFSNMIAPKSRYSIASYAFEFKIRPLRLAFVKPQGAGIVGIVNGVNISYGPIQYSLISIYLGVSCRQQKPDIMASPFSLAFWRFLSRCGYREHLPPQVFRKKYACLLLRQQPDVRDES